MSLSRPQLALTLFKLYPDTSIILDLLDHLPTPADDHTHRMPGHWHLRVARTKEDQLGFVTVCSPPAARKPATTRATPSTQEARTHIDAPADPGPILVPVSKAALVTLPQDIHHHLTGLLRTYKVWCSHEHCCPTACPRVTGQS